MKERVRKRLHFVTGAVATSGEIVIGPIPACWKDNVS
jgi:hypothetical protein